MIISRIGASFAAGTDLLITTDDGAWSDYVIVRYTIEDHDVIFGQPRATISGSFRDLVGGTSDDSVTVQVFHNASELFSATGSAGRLTETDGSFALTALKVAAGDTLSFVVGSHGGSVGDEVALNVSIQFERESSVESGDLALGIQSGHSFADEIGTLRFSGVPGFSYQVEWTSDLADSESWEVVDTIPFLPASLYDVYVEATGGRGFWRMTWDNSE
ncbi:hypothetical protein QEH52_12090 [Coraliomargarita sp. SDUM461003]|uniref:Fibronectin type-III domain-containing protein n=1 Tax=Thalassobacterium maritimum TaxID=3041265 RepID=A0ABU1AYC6_9BACT|nr:hypothetical protein [Coraliomargarita sp. SDUM461003]MDQ8208254.1 hypothetical protein [Coraliomargarita sp. SDUM461003]